MHKVLPYIAVLFCVIAVLVDFTSKFLSLVVDGALLSVVVGIIYLLVKSKPNESDKNS